MTRLQEDFILNEARHVIKREQAITFERIVMLRLRPRFLNDRRLFHRFQQFFLSSFHFPFPPIRSTPVKFHSKAEKLDKSISRDTSIKLPIRLSIGNYSLADRLLSLVIFIKVQTNLIRNCCIISDI